MLYKARDASAVLDQDEQTREQVYVPDYRVVNAHDGDKAHCCHRRERRKRNIAAYQVHDNKHDDPREGDLTADKKRSYSHREQAVLSVEAIEYRKIRTQHDAEQRKGTADGGSVDDEQQKAAQQHGYYDLQRLDEHDDADALPSVTLQKARYTGVIAAVIKDILVKINVRGQYRRAQAAEGVRDQSRNGKQ